MATACDIEMDTIKAKVEVSSEIQSQETYPKNCCSKETQTSQHSETQSQEYSETQSQDSIYLAINRQNQVTVNEADLFQFHICIFMIVWFLIALFFCIVIFMFGRAV